MEQQNINTGYRRMNAEYYSNYIKQYRQEHPEYIKKNVEKEYNKYHSNPEYKEKKKQQALARYYRLKEQSQPILSN